MTRLIFSIAFLLGASAVLWMGSTFDDSNVLGLSIIGVIGAAYTIGFIELLQFRQATRSLSESLTKVSADSSSESGFLTRWLEGLHPSLRNTVHLRIEGERVGLPGPVLTPYLVGLLVMLGLLGTFAGMVDTLKGAVVALQGTTKLEAIRAGLTAPMGGLSLAFGTSVAGVAASAMLGLMSTLSRRERVLATRTLDNCIHNEFRDYSLVHNRQETYRALQAQAKSLPQLTEQLAVMVQQMQAMGEGLGQNLLNNQQQLQASTERLFRDLSETVGQVLTNSIADNAKTLKENAEIAADSGRALGETLQPMIEGMLVQVQADLENHASETYEQLKASAQLQAQVLSEKFGETSDLVNTAWLGGIKEHERANQQLIEQVSGALGDFNRAFESQSQASIEAMTQHALNLQETISAGESKRFEEWARSLDTTHQKEQQRLSDLGQAMVEQLNNYSKSQSARLESSTEQFESVAEKLDGLFRSSEELVSLRLSSETEWKEQQRKALHDLMEMMQGQLLVLRDAEQERATAAVERLSELEGTVKAHLLSLGQSLEEPMTRLIETASETPKAAAEVISQLRNEISKNIEKDNALLEERQRIISDLDGLSTSLAQSSSDQLASVQSLVSDSSQTLEALGQQFQQQVSAELEKMEEMTGSFAGSATELASVGDAFTIAMNVYSESNQKLAEHLERIELALDQSSTRNNEQLEYYVAQAREVIDHSILSQKALFEELKTLSHNPEAADEVE